MKILILGGTGPMGTYLTKILQTRAQEIIVTSRTARPADGNIRFIQGNAKDASFLKPLLDEHWDAIIDFMVYSTGEFQLRSEAILAATRQYCYLSSARVYANSGEALTEDSPRLLDVSSDEAYLATDEYALAKARQENRLFQHKQKNWTIIRPYITYGPHRLQLGVLEKEAWLYRALRGRKIVFTDAIATRTTTMTHGHDVAQGIASLIGQSGALGQAFHITGNDHATWETILNHYLQGMAESNVTASVCHIELERFLRCHGGRYQVIYDRLYDRVFDNTRISQFTDVALFCPIKDGLIECLKKFLIKPAFSPINWAMEAAKDRATNEIIQFKEITHFKSLLDYFKTRLIGLSL